MKPLTIAALIYFAACAAYGAEGTPAHIAQESQQDDVSIAAFRPSDRRSLPLEASLTYATVDAHSAGVLTNILTENGIYADGESLGLMYDINPQLKTAHVPSGSTLRIPVVKGAEWNQLRDAGFLVTITRDAELKQTLLRESERLRYLSGKFRASSSLQKLDNRARSKVAKSLTATVRSVETFGTVIEQRNRPIPTAVLSQVKGEVDSLNGILAREMNSNSPLVSADIDAVDTIADSMRVRVHTLLEERGAGELPKRWPEVWVRVKTRYARNGRDASSYRVYYAPQALYRRSEYIESFDKLTTPSDGSVPPANYMIWVGVPGNPRPVSDLKKLRAREGSQENPVVVDLVIQ